MKKLYALNQSLTLITVFERNAYESGKNVIVGIDEAGRGPLAGPVVACACIFSPELCIDGITDSKKLSPKQRNYFFEYFKSNPDINYGVGIVSPSRIDEINIYQATKEAMYQAIQKLNLTPDVLLVDGMNLPYLTIHSERIVKGDQRSITIAAASIVAKETRDALMVEYHKEWPQYGFEQHKGYPTRNHVEALKKNGPCSIHRRSFKPVQEVLFF
jgi:ribonuclease HII